VKEASDRKEICGRGNSPVSERSKKIPDKGEVTRGQEVKRNTRFKRG
jgi:hypothetical protein